MSDEISRYGGWYKHSNPNYEDFEMWNSVCEDAEPDWEYRNSQRAKREDREREARAAARQEQERREVEARNKKQREEQESREWNAARTAARKEAARKEQESKERKQREEQEKAEKEAQEEMKRKADIAKAKQANDLLDTLNQLLAEIRLKENVEKTRYEEEDAVLGAEEDRDFTSSYEKARFADAARARFQALEDAFGVKKTTSTNSSDDTGHGKSVDTDLTFELNHLEDILKTMAESLRAERTEEVRSKDQDQNLSAGWSVGCVLM